MRFCRADKRQHAFPIQTAAVVGQRPQGGGNHHGKESDGKQGERQEGKQAAHRLGIEVEKDSIVAGIGGRREKAV